MSLGASSCTWKKQKTKQSLSLKKLNTPIAHVMREKQRKMRDNKGEKENKELGCRPPHLINPDFIPKTHFLYPPKNAKQRKP